MRGRRGRCLDRLERVCKQSEVVLRCASGTSHSSIGMMKDLILEAIGLKCSRLADGMVVVL